MGRMFFLAPTSGEAFSATDVKTILRFLFILNKKTNFKRFLLLQRFCE